ncbi:hypothetical protein J8L85_00510 [Maribacter sp. MMG018]|uniref:hypothetical protein n=1 Tax=Maribacter sp. MMG018 TaxID=2822688 RepID=UPI001B36703B|nr:hypothetical protein [Maribacter sp. MMG018]MBQ4912896.1 hypothetical protein [Maribacter sp. MMG018]
MYSSKTDKELLELLQQYSMLTFESQLILKNEIEKRNLSQADVSGLEKAISEKLEKIKNLEYLKDFGFKAASDGEGVVVTRTTNAVLTDVFAVILGLVVFFIGINGIIDLVFTFMNGDELDVFTLAMKLAMASLIFIAIRFFSGIGRLFDYWGFELSNLEGVITLKKRFDVKLEEMKASASELLLETQDDNLGLKLKDRTIFTSNADNLIQRMTLEELVKKLGTH